jgi:ribosomal protein S18 acetylase RimI-like enzyme
VPGAPGIEGLRFRFYVDESDVPALVNVANAFNEAMGQTERWTTEMMALQVRHPSHVPPQQGSLLAFVGDDLVADSSIEFSDTTGGERHYRSLGRIHPDWARRGLGTAMMAFNEGLLLDLARGEAYRGPQKLITWLEDQDVGGIELALRRGYEKVRVYHHMTRPDMDDIDVPPLPEGVEVRPVTAELLPHFWDAATEAFRDHFGGHDFSPEAYTRFAQDPLLELDLIVAAFDGPELVAAVQGAIDPDENRANGYLCGWTDPVFTRRRWRRRGLAHALLGRSLSQLKERGMTSAQLDVDSENDNKALALYQRHRYVVDRSASEWHKPLTP